MSKRGKIRLIAFAIALVAVAAGLFLVMKKQIKNAETALEYTYQRSVADLAAYVDNIDVSLEKTLCSGTEEGAVLHAAKVWREAAAAKACISSLPYSDRRLENTSKFISQVGEYAYSLTNRAASGEEITSEERANLEKLSEYAANLKEQLHSLLSDIANNNYSIKSVMAELKENFEEGETGAFSQMDESYEDYPSLIYDGPFSDHIEKGTAKALEGLNVVTKEKAEATIKKLSGKELKCTGTLESAIPVYVFSSDTIYAEITVTGGMLINYSDSRDVSETKHSVADAIDAADKLLKENGYSSMTMTYYLEDDNTLLINYAYSEENAVCYADLVKVRIAMDDLSAVGFEAAGYIANHTDRDKPEIKISQSEALNSISPYLTPEKGQMAYICPNGLTEYFVYEIQCVAESGRQVLVYIDAVTGREVDLLLLLDTPGGTLTI